MKAIDTLRQKSRHRHVRIHEQTRLQEEKQRNFILSAIGSGIFVAIVMWIWPSVIPYSFFELWRMHDGNVGDWLWTAKWVFAWGTGVTILSSILTRNKPEENREAESRYGKGIIISTLAGVLEETAFRWLIFMSSIVMAIVSNALFPWVAGFLIFILVAYICAKATRSLTLIHLGISLFLAWLVPHLLTVWLGANVPEYLQVHLFGPVANFFTLGLLSDQLTNPANWAIGAAIIASNGFFRDGHKYLGWFGFLNSWFIGMFFFYLMFTYGLPAAILVHFIYDFLIFTVRYVDEAIERAQGNA